jgi:hypothetical protein
VVAWLLNRWLGVAVAAAGLVFRRELSRWEWGGLLACAPAAVDLAGFLGSYWYLYLYDFEWSPWVFRGMLLLAGIGLACLSWAVAQRTARAGTGG